MSWQVSVAILYILCWIQMRGMIDAIHCALYFLFRRDVLFPICNTSSSLHDGT